MQPFHLRPAAASFNLTRSSNSSPSPITRSFKVARQQPLIRAAHTVLVLLVPTDVTSWEEQRPEANTDLPEGDALCSSSSVSFRGFNRYRGQEQLFADVCAGLENMLRCFLKKRVSLSLPYILNGETSSSTLAWQNWLRTNKRHKEPLH